MDAGGFGSGEVFEIEVSQADVPVGRLPASALACREDALFREVIAGRVPNDGSLPEIVATAIWDAHSGSSHSSAATTAEVVGGAVLRTASAVDPSLAVDALELQIGSAPPRRYKKGVFEAQALAFVDDLVDQGQLKDLENVSWKLVENQTPAPAPSLRAQVSREPLPLSRSRLPDVEPGELAVELDAQLLEMLRADFRSAGPVEHAFLLVGSVSHDPERGAAALHALTAVSVEMGRGGASQVHFAFEPRAFVQARQRAERDFDDLVTLGWAHSHPPCEGCPQNPDCSRETRFFSAADVEVHTSAFASPFMLGLVVGKAGTAPATEPGFRLYGWRDAQVQEISYRVT